MYQIVVNHARDNCLPHPALRARLTAEGTEYFWIEIALSAAQLGLQKFEFEKLPSSKFKGMIHT